MFQRKKFQRKTFQRKTFKRSGFQHVYRLSLRQQIPQLQ